MCNRATIGTILVVGALVIASFLIAAFLTLFSAEMHLLNKNRTLNPFRSEPTPEGTYPFKTGVKDLTRKFSSRFQRYCKSFKDCTFTVDVHKYPQYQEPGNNPETVSIYFSCDKKDNRCSCREHPGIQFPWARLWDVRWCYQNLICQISENGPCGRQNGLWITCLSPYQCISDRCRDIEKYGERLIGEDCVDDYDCHSELICERPCSGSINPELAVGIIRKQCQKPIINSYGKNIGTSCRKRAHEHL